MELLVTDEEDRILAELMSAAQGGDSAQYVQLLTRVSELTKRYVSKRVDEGAWVDEVVQETLISIHESRHTYDPSRSFASWMFAIAHHRVIDHFRKLKRRLELEEDTGGELPDVAIEAFSPDDTREVAARIIATLPPRQRKVVELLKLDGLSVREVASRLKMTEGAVKVMAHRAYESLRKLGRAENENE